jgi:hypothetical protein
VLDRLAGDGADRRGVLVKVGSAVGEHLEKLARTVAEELVETDLDLKRGSAELLEQLGVLLGEEGELLRGRLGVEDVAEAHVLKALVLADVVVVAVNVSMRNVKVCGDMKVKPERPPCLTTNSRNVDTGGNTTSSKRQHLEGGKVGLGELLLLKVGSPRKTGDEQGSGIDEPSKLLGHLLVDYRNEALPLGAGASGVTVAES